MSRTPGSILSIDFVTHADASGNHPEHPHAYRSLPEMEDGDLNEDQNDSQTKKRQKRQFAGSTASVHIGYQRSSTFGLGSVECWVDQSHRRKRIDGYWDMKARNSGE